MNFFLRKPKKYYFIATVRDARQEVENIIKKAKGKSLTPERILHYGYEHE